MSETKTIVFFPEPGAWGPTNNCVAIAEVLGERGHRVVFVLDASFETLLAAKGFEEPAARHGSLAGASVRFMYRNATSAATYFRLPSDQTIELGLAVEL